MNKLKLTENKFVLVVDGFGPCNGAAILTDPKEFHLESFMPVMIEPFISENGVCNNIKRFDYVKNEWIMNLSAKESFDSFLINNGFDPETTIYMLGNGTTD